MPIVSSTVWKYHNRGNGKLAVFEAHTDHNGEVHENRYRTNVGHDLDAQLAINAVKKSAGLINAEKEKINKAIQNGADPATITTTHISTTQKAKQAIKALMFGDSRKTLKAALYIQGFSDAQIENHFNVEKRIKIRTMQNFVIDNQAVLASDLREEI